MPVTTTRSPSQPAVSPPAASGRLPEGTVTFLFSDIEGSTQLWDRHADRMTLALARHDGLMRAAIQDHGGAVFKTVGDAFCATFTHAVDALHAAMAAQNALAAEPWSEFGASFPSLRVRIGLHTGAAELRDGDYFGPPLNRVARLEAAGHGGQILVSLVTQQLLRDTLPAGVSLRDLGEHRLRDLQNSEHIFQVVSAGFPDVKEPPRTAGRLTARDRILADDSAEAHSVREALGLLLGAARDESLTVSMRPELLRDVARHRPADLTEYRLGRVASWSQPQFRLDGRFVELALLIDQGEASVTGRWTTKEQRYQDLHSLALQVPDPALVILGPPGSGKSTLLRRLELDLALAALRGEADRVTFYLELNHYRPHLAGGGTQTPASWLAANWEQRFPDLPDFAALLGTGRMTLLLDALNEMQVADESEFHEAVRLWKEFVHDTLQRAPSTRVVFSCRSLDYSAPLSTPDLRVPQVRIEPMSDDQVSHFLQVYSPLRWRELWAALKDAPQLEILRSPYFLKLLVDQVEDEGQIPRGQASLFTGFVRQALRREVERDNPLFQPGRLLSTRDIRRIATWRWRTPWELPDYGVLIPKLYGLAYAMQSGRAAGKAAQLRLDYDEALDVLDDAEHDVDIVRAGLALSVLDEDTLNDEILYIHQLVQEYFAAQRLASMPEIVGRLVEAPWRAEDIRPRLDAALAMIAPADPLPPLPATGWEQTTLLAAAMTEEPDAFIGQVMATNLALAGRCATQPDVQISDALRHDLSAALVRRSRDPAADLRARIDAATVLGRLGDPRFERRHGPDGAYLWPPLVELPAGTYILGRDDPDAGDESPRHALALSAFKLAQFPVTNAEYACFVAAGGYDDERWWDTEAARAWQRGEGTAEGNRNGARYWHQRYLNDPELLNQRQANGQLDADQFAVWRDRLAMDDEAFEAHLRTIYSGGRETEPRFWHDADFNQPLQPVVGISWFEARAYANWLAAQSGQPIRLPSEAEWEAAARGPSGRRFAFGDDALPWRANTVESHIRRTSPVGIFPDGDSPEGLVDLTGNTWEWTASVFGASLDAPEFDYPYRPDDGREDPQAGAEMNRVARGGSWFWDLDVAQATTRYTFYPDGRNFSVGFRLAMSA